MSVSSLAKTYVSRYELSPKQCGQYSIHENDDGCILGQGGFGIVTRQKCGFEKIKCKGEYVAKKTLKHYDANEISQVKKEELIYNKLSKNPSEYVLSMYGSMIDNKNRKITQYFQYIGGKELVDYQDTRFIKDIVIGLIQGLIYIHDQDVIHCDIKPFNILVDTSKEPHCPVYIDFGGSVQLSNKDDEGVLTTKGFPDLEYGSTSYFRIDSEYKKGYITARSDVYALLITFRDTPLKYDRKDEETVYIAALRELKLLDVFIKMLNYDGSIIYENIWPNWKLITNMVRNNASPSRVLVNNTNHNDPPSFYTMSPMTRARMLGKDLINNARTHINKQVKKIKGMLTSRTRRRERTPKYAYAKQIQPQGRKKDVDIYRMGIEMRNIEAVEIARQEEKEQRMMEDNLEKQNEAKMLAEREAKMLAERQAERNKQIIEMEWNDDEDEDEDEEVDEALFEGEVAKRAESKRTSKRNSNKRTSKRNSNTSRISTTQQDMNGYVGGVSKKKFRRSSKKIGKIRNRRRSSKKRR